MSKQKQYIVIGEIGPLCPRCQQNMQIREHNRITSKHLAQPFYYSRWYNCMNEHCRTQLVMAPEFIVWKDWRTRDRFEIMAATRKQLTPRA